MDKLLDELMELLSEEELIRLARRADMQVKLALSVYLEMELIKRRDEKAVNQN